MKLFFCDKFQIHKICVFYNLILKAIHRNGRDFSILMYLFKNMKKKYGKKSRKKCGKYSTFGSLKVELVGESMHE